MKSGYPTNGIDGGQVDSQWRQGVANKSGKAAVMWRVRYCWMLCLHRWLATEEDYRRTRWQVAKLRVLRRRLAEAGKEIEFLARLAIVVRPKQPYYAWARSLEPESASAFDTLLPKDLNNVYLVNQRYVTKPERVLRRYYRHIFADQLCGWSWAEEAWPAPRTWELFQQWFDAELIEPVHDLGIGPLIERVNAAELRRRIGRSSGGS